MPRRIGRPERVTVGRDRRGRFVPVGAFVPGRAAPVPATSVPVRRDPRTGQFVSTKAPVPTPRHPRTGRFITRAEDEALRARRPDRDMVRGFIDQSPRLRIFYADLSAAQRDWFDGRMLHWQRAGFEPRMAGKISVDEFERGEEYETSEQVPDA